MDDIIETINSTLQNWPSAIISAIVSIIVSLITNYSVKKRQLEKFGLDKKFAQYENLFQYYKELSILSQKVKLSFSEFYKFGINRPDEYPEDEKYFNEILSNATTMMNTFRDNIYYNAPFIPDRLFDKILSFYYILQDATEEYMTNRNSFLKDKIVTDKEIVFEDYVNLTYKQKISDAHRQLILFISAELRK